MMISDPVDAFYLAITEEFLSYRGSGSSLQHYTPTPQPHNAGGEMYGKIDGQIPFPDTPAGWATKEWLNFTLRIDTNAPWLKRKTKKLIDNFEIVVGSRCRQCRIFVLHDGAVCF